jgi:3-hydroxyacyl-CoA dehydrogenase
MKKLLMICALGLATVMNVQAQRERSFDRSPEKQAERITERMTEKLSLDESQQNEIYAFHLERAEKRKAEMEHRRQAMTEARTAYQE